MNDLEREFEIDWAAWLCEGHNVLKLTRRRIDPDEAKAFFKVAWAMGRCRGARAGIRLVEHCQELVG